MSNVKVLGVGCSNCKATVKLIEAVAQAKGTPVTVEKVEDMQEIMQYGIMATPGLVIDGRVVHAGGIPARAKVEGWFTP